MIRCLIADLFSINKKACHCTLKVRRQASFYFSSSYFIVLVLQVAILGSLCRENIIESFFISFNRLFTTDNAEITITKHVLYYFA